MADDADWATGIAERELAHLIENRPPVPAGPGPSCCTDCGDSIPAPRRALGYERCVTCQEIKERARP